MIERYDFNTDTMVGINEEWCVAMQKQMGLLSMQREIIRSVSGMNVVEYEDRIRQIWDFLRGLGLEETLAKDAEEQERREAISAGINAAIEESFQWD